MKGDDEYLRVPCFLETSFMTDKYEWKPMFLLKVNDKIIILRKDLKNLSSG